MTVLTRSSNTVARLSTLIVICFFFSGMSGLIYEILWTRMTVSVIGGAPFAVATILTVFMGGLGLGSYLAARTIDRIMQPLKLVRLYGILELLIGVYGLLLPLLLIAFKPAFALLYRQLFHQFMAYNLLTFVGCSVLLIFPVTCMGATLPILCRFYVTRLGHLGTHAGRLYGLNTIGAAAGSLLCGFWLINLLGMWGTLAVAASINGLIGVLCLVIKNPERVPNETHGSTPTAAATPDEPAPEQQRGAIFSALLIFAVSGFCAMAYEVIWTKLLGLIVGPTTYSFTIVLVTFILGLALGSLIFGRLADLTRNALYLLVGTQVAAGLFALGVSQVLGGSQLFFAKLIFVYQDQFALRTFLKAVSLFVLMLLPTLCLGATFPLVGKIFTRAIARVGRSIGLAYAVNTIGAVLGSFAAGFVLVPLIGKESGLSLVVGLQLATVLVVSAIMLVKNKTNVARWSLLIILALAGIALCARFPTFNRRLLSVGKAHRVHEIADALKGHGWLETLVDGEEILMAVERGELLYYSDGIGGFTTVLKNVFQLGDTYISMANSGKVDASTRGDMPTQTLLAHFPMLFHPGAKTVMVLGLASGITAGEVLHYPVERLDVVEINKQVIAASDFFIPWNNDVLKDPRTNLIVQDGRAHLGLTDQRYDIIISEPSNPWLAGLATLFTQDFFALARNRLNEGGIFVQFIHSYKMDWPTFAMVGRTLARVFPNSLLLTTAPSGLGPDYLLVGFKSPGHYLLDVAEENLPYAKASTNINLMDTRLVYRMILSENLPVLFGEGPVHTDVRPRLEFRAPKLLYHNDDVIQRTIEARRQLSEETQAIRSQVESDVDLQIDYTAYALSVHSLVGGMVDLERASPRQRERFFDVTDSYFVAHSANLDLIQSDSLRRHWRSVQANAIERSIDSLPDKALSYSYLGGLYSEDNRPAEAIESYRKSLQYESEVAAVHCNLGVVMTKLDSLDEAVIHFNEALRINPVFPDAHSGLGLALARKGKVGEAIGHLRRAVEMDPDDIKAHHNLGLALAQQGNPDEAILSFSRAVELQPLFADAHCNLGVALTQKGRLDEAEQHFIEALRINPDFEVARSGLERARFLKQVGGR